MGSKSNNAYIFSSQEQYRNQYFQQLEDNGHLIIHFLTSHESYNSQRTTGSHYTKTTKIIVYLQRGLVEYTPGKTSCPLPCPLNSDCSLEPILRGPLEGTLLGSPVDRKVQKISLVGVGMGEFWYLYVCELLSVFLHEKSRKSLLCELFA